MVFLKRFLSSSDSFAEMLFLWLCVLRVFTLFDCEWILLLFNIFHNRLLLMFLRLSLIHGIIYKFYLFSQEYELGFSWMKPLLNKSSNLYFFKVLLLVKFVLICVTGVLWVFPVVTLHLSFHLSLMDCKQFILV